MQLTRVAPCHAQGCVITDVSMLKRPYSHPVWTPTWGMGECWWGPTLMWPGSPPLPERARSRSMELADPGAPALDERTSTILGTTAAAASPLGLAYAAGGGVCTCCTKHQRRSPHNLFTSDVTLHQVVKCGTAAALFQEDLHTVSVGVQSS